MMLEFIEYTKHIYPISDDALQQLLECCETVTYPKGTILIREGIREPYVYFIVQGFARGFFYKEDRDVTIWFASTGMSLLSMNGYLFNSAGYENIELMEDATLLRITNHHFDRLLNQNIELANWGRRMSDHIVLKLEQLFMERYFLPAAERYRLLIEKEPEILQKVPLRHIASYLGISQVSLSRIRAGIQ